MAQRIIFDVILLLSYFFIGWHAAGFVAVAGIILFNHFWEAVVLGVLLDSLFGLHSGFLTAVFVLLYIGAYYTKHHIRWYEA